MRFPARLQRAQCLAESPQAGARTDELSAPGLPPPGPVLQPRLLLKWFFLKSGVAVTPINLMSANKQVSWGRGTRDTPSPSSFQHCRRWRTAAGEGPHGRSALRSPPAPVPSRIGGCTVSHSPRDRTKRAARALAASASLFPRVRTCPRGPARPFRVKVCRPPRPPPR